MSINDFNIVEGLLIKYTGTDKNVVIPDGVIKVGINAFLDNKDLEQVTFAKSVEEICESAFSGCDKLKKITLNCRIIGAGAFENCTGLKTVVLEESVRIIGGSAFDNCKIKNMTVKGYGKVYCHRNEHGFNGCTIDELYLEYGPLDDGDRFNNCKNSKIESLTIEKGDILSYSFYNCDFLKKVKLDSGVKTVNHSAFEGCTELKEAIIDSAEVKRRAFFGCTKLNKVILGCRNIRDAFGGCKNIKTLGIKKSVKTLDMINLARVWSKGEIYCEVKKQPSGWKYQDKIEQFECEKARISGNYDTHIHWGADISKI